MFNKKITVFCTAAMLMAFSANAEIKRMEDGRIQAGSLKFGLLHYGAGWKNSTDQNAKPATMKYSADVKTEGDKTIRKAVWTVYGGAFNVAETMKLSDKEADVKWTLTHDSDEGLPTSWIAIQTNMTNSDYRTNPLTVNGQVIPFKEKSNKHIKAVNGKSTVIIPRKKCNLELTGDFNVNIQFTSWGTFIRFYKNDSGKVSYTNRSITIKELPKAK